MKLKLKEFREARHLSQKELAELIGMSYRSIQQWERGDTFPNAYALCDLCTVLGAEPNELLGWYDEHPEDRPSASVTRDESALLSNYRASPPEGRDFVARAAMMACGQSKEGHDTSSEAEAV